MVELDRLSIVYSTPNGPVPAVESVSLQLGAGGIHALIGPSGSGKSSLIAAMAGLVRIRSGTLLVDGEPVSGIRRRTAVIFQDYGLLPWKTVAANAELPLLLAGVQARARRIRVSGVLEELGLAPFAGLHPARLSGGMRQRLAIARALVQEPDLLLMDEPFSSLDALTRESMQDMLLAVHARHGATIVLVTHSIEEAAYLSDTVTVMAGRNPGRVGVRFLTGREPGGSRGTREHDDSTFRSDTRFLGLTTKIRSALESGS